MSTAVSQKMAAGQSTLNLPGPIEFGGRKQGTPKGMDQIQAKWFATGAIENFGDFRADEAFRPFSFIR
jgi:hypothetical protein